MPKPVGETGGGMANAIVGTLILTGLGSAFAVPIGVLSGVYMSEYAGTRFASLVRFAADTLNGVPSIVIGVFVYGDRRAAVQAVQRDRGRPGARRHDDPDHRAHDRGTAAARARHDARRRAGARRDAQPRGLHRGAAVGACRGSSPASCWRWPVSPARRRRCCSPSFNNRFFTTSLTQPIASLTVQVFTYAISPYKDWHRQAWAGALVLVTIVFLCSLLARFATRRLESIQSM